MPRNFKASRDNLLKTTNIIYSGAPMDEDIQRALAVSEAGHRSIRATPLGAEINPDTTQTECEEFLEQVLAVQTGIQWIIGDLLIHMERTWGQTYNEFETLTGYSYGTLRNLAMVSRAVNLSSRDDKLSWRHYFEIVTRGANVQEWAQQAIQQHWSTRQLVAALEGLPLVGQTPQTRITQRLHPIRKAFLRAAPPERTAYIHELERLLAELKAYSD